MSLESKRCAQCLSFREALATPFSTSACQPETPHSFCEPCLAALPLFFLCPLPFCKRPLHKSSLKKGDVSPADSFSKVVRKESKIECPDHKQVFTHLCLTPGCVETGQPACAFCLSTVHSNCPRETLPTIPEFLAASKPDLTSAFQLFDSFLLTLDKNCHRLKEPERVFDMLKTETRFLMRAGTKILSEDGKHFQLQKREGVYLIKSSLLVRLEDFIGRANKALEAQKGTATDSDFLGKFPESEVFMARHLLKSDLKRVFAEWNQHSDHPKFEFFPLIFGADSIFVTEKGPSHAPGRPGEAGDRERRISEDFGGTGSKTVLESSTDKSKWELTKTTSIRKVPNGTEGFGVTSFLKESSRGPRPDPPRNFFEQFKEKLGAISEKGGQKSLGISVDEAGNLELVDIGEAVARQLQGQLSRLLGSHAQADAATLESLAILRLSVSEIQSEVTQDRQKLDREISRLEDTLTQGLQRLAVETDASKPRPPHPGAGDSHQKIPSSLSNQVSDQRRPPTEIVPPKSISASKNILDSSPNSSGAASDTLNTTNSSKLELIEELTQKFDSKIQEVLHRFSKLEAGLSMVGVELGADKIDSDQPTLKGLDEAESRARQLEAELAKVALRLSIFPPTATHLLAGERSGQSLSNPADKSGRLLGMIRAAQESLSTVVAILGSTESEAKITSEKIGQVEEDTKRAMDEATRLSRNLKDLTGEIKKEFMGIKERLNAMSDGDPLTIGRKVEGGSDQVRRQLSVPQRFGSALQRRDPPKDQASLGDELHLRKDWSLGLEQGGPEDPYENKDALLVKLAHRVEKLEEKLINDLITYQKQMSGSTHGHDQSSLQQTETSTLSSRFTTLRMESLLTDFQALAERVLTLEIRVAKIGDQESPAPHRKGSQAGGSVQVRKSSGFSQSEAPGSDSQDALEKLQQKLRAIKNRIEISDVAIISNAKEAKTNAAKVAELTEAVKDQSLELQRLENRVKETLELFQVELEGAKRSSDGPIPPLRLSLESFGSRQPSTIESKLLGREAVPTSQRLANLRKRELLSIPPVPPSTRDSAPASDTKSPTVFGNRLSGLRSSKPEFQPKNFSSKKDLRIPGSTDPPSNGYTALN